MREIHSFRMVTSPSKGMAIFLPRLPPCLSPFFQWKRGEAGQAGVQRGGQSRPLGQARLQSSLRTRGPARADGAPDKSTPGRRGQFHPLSAPNLPGFNQLQLPVRRPNLMRPTRIFPHRKRKQGRVHIKRATAPIQRSIPPESWLPIPAQGSNAGIKIDIALQFIKKSIKKHSSTYLMNTENKKETWMPRTLL